MHRTLLLSLFCAVFAADVAKRILVPAGTDPSDPGYEVIRFGRPAQYKVYREQCVLFSIEDGEKVFVDSYDSNVDGNQYFINKNFNQQVRGGGPSSMPQCILVLAGSCAACFS